MAWDLAMDAVDGDLTGGIVTGQDEILQRITTRLWRHLGEWFMNTSAGLPWYAGPSSIMAGELSPDTAILGNRNFRVADVWIRREIADTEGVIEIVDYRSGFDSATRVFSVKSNIVTEYGSAYINFNYSTSRTAHYVT